MNETFSLVPPLAALAVSAISPFVFLRSACSFYSEWCRTGKPTPQRGESMFLCLLIAIFSPPALVLAVLLPQGAAAPLTWGCAAAAFLAALAGNLWLAARRTRPWRSLLSSELARQKAVLETYTLPEDR